MFILLFYEIDARFLVRAATTYPHIMKYLPTLLPGKFLNLLLKEGKEEEEMKEQQHKNEEENMEASPDKCDKIPLLARLEECLKSEAVWKFGFSHVSKTGYWEN